LRCLIDQLGLESHRLQPRLTLLSMKSRLRRSTSWMSHRLLMEQHLLERQMGLRR
jgi:hypothetical protein